MRSCPRSSGTASSSPTRSLNGTATWDGHRVFPAGTPPARRKVELLHKCFPSQRHRDWWDDEVFLGLPRLRGMVPGAIAEAFHCAKSVIVPLVPLRAW